MTHFLIFVILTFMCCFIRDFKRRPFFSKKISPDLGKNQQFIIKQLSGFIWTELDHLLAVNPKGYYDTIVVVVCLKSFRAQGKY